MHSSKGDFFCDVKVEAAVAATMGSHASSVDVDSGFVIDGAKVEQHALAGPTLRYVESMKVPRMRGVFGTNTFSRVSTGAMMDRQPWRTHLRVRSPDRKEQELRA